MKKSKNDVQDNKAVLNEKLSVAELRIYEGFYDGKDRFLPLTKTIVVRDDNDCRDIISGKEYNVYQMLDGKFYPFTNNTGEDVELGDVFCSIERDLSLKENIFNYMTESDDFYYYRLPYLQERFDLYSRCQSSYVSPRLKYYQRKISNDKLKREKVDLLLDEHVKLLKEYDNNNKSKVLKMNTKKKC